MRDIKKKADSKKQPIPVIDIFAGPGGLGEGFSSLNNNSKFRIVLSIEKDEFAHETLSLRAFVRQFPQGALPDEYYQFVKGEIRKEELFKKFPQQSDSATEEAWKVELGKDNDSSVDQRISAALNKAKNWVLIGGPPCQAYSLAGRSRKQQKILDSETDPRVYLYRQYYRILAVHNPPAFVMENVKGLLSSKLTADASMFQEIINDLEDPVTAYEKLNGEKKEEMICPGYNIYSLIKEPDEFEASGKPVYSFKDFVIKAEDYGVPQTRHRVILLGIRKDIDIKPSILKKRGKNVTVRDVITGLPPLRSGLSKGEDNKTNWRKAVEEITVSSAFGEISRDVKKNIKKLVKNFHVSQKDRGALFVEYNPSVKDNKKWFIDKNLKGVCNHESRGHINDDLHRYFFASVFAKIHRRSPKLHDFPMSLLPNHKNARTYESLDRFTDRFRVQIWDEPAKTITSHISKDGHYFIHPDPVQCRSLTVREAARIQTFPDNYYFCGPRTAQYGQVGNAVPPYLAFQIAGVVSGFFQSLDNNGGLKRTTAQNG